MKIKILNRWWPAIPALLLLLMVSMSAEIDEPFNSEWLLQSKSLESSTVLLSNPKNVIPLGTLESRKIAVLSIGAVFEHEFSAMLKNYAAVSGFKLVNTNLQTSVDTVNAQLKFFNTVVLQATDASLKDPPLLNLIKELAKTKQVVLVLFGNTGGLQFLENIEIPVIWSPANTEVAATFSAQAVFGGVALSGRLQQDVSPQLKKGAGYTTKATRLKYTVPEEVGVDSKELGRPIDRIVNEAIEQKATPGAVVMIIKDGKVIFNKGYGDHTYTGGLPTKANDIFDLASVTKIGATTMAAMRLYEEKKLELDMNIGAYIPLARNTNKNDLTVKELLLHQAGLVAYIPFYENLRPGDYSRDSSIFHPVKVADHYYLRSNYFQEVMWPRMLKSTLSARGKYVYSDLSMYLMKDIIERLSAERLDKYVEKQFYAPLGMYTAGFNPRNRFPKTQIVPTEQDNYFRKTLLEGYVHDQGAAMAGGISGHAGLFSTANDMGILFQMILNGGTYGGKQYFKHETIDLFTAQYSNVSRRGLGFDRWDPDRTNRYPSDLASPKSYGHTGYTGTCVWVDPEHKLIYIFLSNRVHPTVSNKLNSLRIRPRIHDAIYKAIRDGLD